jgi:chromosome segregation ATPase
LGKPKDQNINITVACYLIHKGNSITETEIKNIVGKFNIQVDNLCQFLPQDKVSGFAQMKMKELLVETERAAGQELLIMHEKLGEFQIKEHKGDAMIEMHKTELIALREKNAMLDRDVQRLQERETMKKEIKRTETMLVVAKYDPYLIL